MSHYLVPTLVMGREENKKMNMMLNSLFENPNSEEFRIPVDYKGLGLVDYPMIIKNPMDLGTIRKNLKANKYKYVEECINDIQLVWDNCKTYNKEDSWIYIQADKLEKYTKKVVKNHFPMINFPKPSKLKESSKAEAAQFEDIGGDDIGETIPYAEKIRLSNMVKSLTQEQLGQVVKIIQEEAPSAFKEIDRERYQIHLDNLDRDTFQKLIDFIEGLAKIESNEQATKRVKYNQ
eukprot:TRINITY_DN1563_c0_g1_i2.p1 TRINITY_DN1563_c0_g1~~TRINITY_DN1563_c0_g1_i2.p1  ORF type:complete len:234 (-),score=46.53 TRINITY_DN1563_c0_g1_i2:112-813(-)